MSETVTGDAATNPSLVDGAGDGSRPIIELEPVGRVDMNEFSQSELYSLARSSSDFDLQSPENLVISNVSSNYAPPYSTKTTSTISPSKIFAFSHPRGPRRRISAEEDDPQLMENRLILDSLEKLVAEGDADDSNPRKDAVVVDNEGEVQRRKRTRKPKAPEENEEEFEGLGAINLNGEEIDLKYLARVADGAFAAELNRRTEGMTLEDEFLGFMYDLQGQWGSHRKRRMYVDAACFLKALPGNWKILLAFRPRIRQPSLYCRSFVSPSCQHFKSCKDVAVYLKSQFATKDANPPEKLEMTNIVHESEVDLESKHLLVTGQLNDHPQTVQNRLKQKLTVKKKQMKRMLVDGEGSLGFQDQAMEQKNCWEGKRKLRTTCMCCLVEFFREPGDEKTESLLSSSAFRCLKCNEEANNRRAKSRMLKMNQHAFSMED